MNFDYNGEVKARVMSIPGSSYSSTNRCFYVDDSEENLKLIIKTLKDTVDIDISALVVSEIRKEDQPAEKIRRDDAIKVPEEKKIKGDVRGWGSYGPVEFRIKEDEGVLVIKFLGRYDSEWIREIRSYGWCRYDEVSREWLLRWSKVTTDSLADYFSGKGIKLKITKQKADAKLIKERKATGEDLRSKLLGRKSLDGLDSVRLYLEENRYSPRTIESYLAALEFFFRYFSDRDPVCITEEDIGFFLHDYIIRLGYSAAYQNQMISAIKVYYAIAGKGRINLELLGRPRRIRALPKVFSKEEVSSILNSAGNTKHKLLLWIIYSCGLRRSEVTNIRLTDLDRERGIIHIRAGKGMVDRIVPVSVKVWEKIDEYLRAYNPRKYIFEGQGGGRYSTESVYRVFKTALKKAGIMKEVGVHCLRHSYATHLHENGLDIRYIQELLGHKSSRTTEIYTHVSRRNLIQVRSPIDDLDVK